MVKRNFADFNSGRRAKSNFDRVVDNLLGLRLGYGIVNLQVASRHGDFKGGSRINWHIGGWHERRSGARAAEAGQHDAHLVGHGEAREAYGARRGVASVNSSKREGHQCGSCSSADFHRCVYCGGVLVDGFERHASTVKTGGGEAAHADSGKVTWTLRRNGGHEAVRAMGRIKRGGKSCRVGDGIAQGAEFDL